MRKRVAHTRMLCKLLPVLHHRHRRQSTSKISGCGKRRCRNAVVILEARVLLLRLHHPSIRGDTRGQLRRSRRQRGPHIWLWRREKLALSLLPHPFHLLIRLVLGLLQVLRDVAVIL